MNRPEGVVLDCDGLLLDTEEYWAWGEEALFASYGQPYTPEDRQLLLGVSNKTAGEILSHVLTQPGREAELAAELLSLCWDEVVAGACPHPGAAELVRRLSGRVPLGLASNSPRTLVEEAVDASGFSDAFDVILGSEDVSCPKPAPEMYLVVCERLAVRPSRSVALEDSPTGVAAARTAGLYVIGVPSHPGVFLDADLIAASLEHQSVWQALGIAEFAE